MMNPNLTPKQNREYLEKKWGKWMENHNGYPTLDSKDTVAMGMILENMNDFYSANNSFQDSVTVTTATSNVSVTGAGGVMLPGILAPTVRRLFPQMKFRELCHTQIMNLPESKVYYSNPMFATNATPNTAERMDDLTKLSETGAVDPGEAIDILANVSVEMADSSLKAVASKLIATFSQEQVQDYSAYGLGSILQDLIFLAVTEINMITEAKVLTNMFATTVNNVDWSKTSVLADDLLSTVGIQSHDKTILKAIEDASLLIRQKKFVAPTWIAASPTVCSRLRKLQEFEISSNMGQSELEVATKFWGTLNGQYKLYEVPVIEVCAGGTNKEKLLLGYKSNDLSKHRGYVYAPYILAYLSDVTQNPKNLTNAFGYMSRYDNKMIDADMFATVTIIA